MTDLDPLRTPPPEGSELPRRPARDQGGDRPRGAMPLMDGPTGHAMTTESVGDPDRRTVASGAEAGAGAGTIAGAALAGPFGLPVGAAAGGAAGAAAEAADEDRDVNPEGPLSEPASPGTGPVDPKGEPGADEWAAQRLRDELDHDEPDEAPR